MFFRAGVRGVRARWGQGRRKHQFWAFASASERKRFQNRNMKRPAAGPWMVEYICSDQAAAGRHYAGCGWFTITHCLRRVRLVSGHIARIVRIARSSGGEDSDCEQASVARIVEAGCPLAQTLIF